MVILAREDVENLRRCDDADGAKVLLDQVDAMDLLLVEDLKRVKDAVARSEHDRARNLHAFV